MLETREIDIAQIKANRYQPREHFDSDSLFELAQSIKSNGLIQPIIVREIENEHYEIIAGERRYRASMLAGLTSVMCIVTKDDDEASAQKALIENIQRENLNSIEEAKAYLAIMKSEKMTQEQLAKRVGKSQSAIANKIRLLNLPEEIQEAVLDRKITERHARALIGLDEQDQSGILKSIIEKGLNVSQTERMVEASKEPKAVHGVSKGYTKNTKIAINTIKQAIKMIEKTGIPVQYSESDKESEVIVTIRIPK